MRTAVILHNTAQSCVEATRHTMRSLGSDLIEEGGRFFIPGSPSDYPVWAALMQGYVKGLAGPPSHSCVPQCPEHHEGQPCRAATDEPPTMSPCRSCGGAPKFDKRPPAPDGWTRIGCWNDACDHQPTTGWFRDDANSGVEASATWERMCAEGRNEEAARRDERKANDQ